MATRKTLARKLNVSVATIRSWERYFDDMLTSAPGGRGHGRQKTFTAADVRVLATVARLRDVEMSLADIKQCLDVEVENTPLEGDVVTDVIVSNTVGTSAELVPVSEYVEVVRRVEAVESQLTAVTGERDRLLDEVQSERRLHVEAVARAASAEASLTGERRLSRLALGVAAVALLVLIVLAVLVLV